ncbi:hypothetical protein V2I01_18000 [Micromonospora sp. BRA006-A]|nr:hypothetical protein [Micromonospora sp. BRA006-A]
MASSRRPGQRVGSPTCPRAAGPRSWDWPTGRPFDGAPARGPWVHRRDAGAGRPSRALRDPVVYRVKDYDLCLRRAQAAHVLIRDAR